jgi:hypothetical protein
LGQGELQALQLGKLFNAVIRKEKLWRKQHVKIILPPAQLKSANTTGSWMKCAKTSGKNFVTLQSCEERAELA